MGGPTTKDGAHEQRDRLAAVSAVADATTSLMALLYGAFLGALSALLVVAVAIRLFPDFVGPIDRAALGMGAWVASTWLFSRSAPNLLVVFRRAFLAGACEWLALALWGRGEPVALAASAVGGAARAASEDFFAGGLAVGMVWLCLLGYLFCRWSSPPQPARGGTA